MLVKQRSVAHSVHLSACGRSSAPAGTSADVSRGSSREATWFDTVISACWAQTSSMVIVAMKRRKSIKFAAAFIGAQQIQSLVLYVMSSKGSHQQDATPKQQGIVPYLASRPLQRLLHDVAALHMRPAEDLHECLGRSAHACQHQTLHDTMGSVSDFCRHWASAPCPIIQRGLLLRHRHILHICSLLTGLAWLTASAYPQGPFSAEDGIIRGTNGSCSSIWCLFSSHSGICGSQELSLVCLELAEILIDLEKPLQKPRKCAPAGDEVPQNASNRHMHSCTALTRHDGSGIWSRKTATSLKRAAADWVNKDFLSEAIRS